jgi:hypothetical protein
MLVSTTLAGTCAQETVLDEGKQAENKTARCYPPHTQRKSGFSVVVNELLKPRENL